MNSAAWKKRISAIDDVFEQNQRINYECAKCGEKTVAPKNTSRAIAKRCKDCFGKREDLRRNELNDLTGSEWAQLSKSVEQYPGVRSEKQRAHGAAFPQSLAEAHIAIYTKKADLVLDPFVGVGTTLDAAKKLRRRSIGIELNPHFARVAADDLGGARGHRVICADAQKLQELIDPNSVDMVLTSPPYATLLKSIKGAFAYKWREHSELKVVSNPRPYSNEQADLGNLGYGDFMESIRTVMSGCWAVMKPGAYAVWVIKDYRDLKNGVPYINFHGDIIRAAESASFTLWDIRVYDQTKFRPLVVLGYPSRNYYMNIGHSYVLIFRKWTEGKSIARP